MTQQITSRLKTTPEAPPWSTLSAFWAIVVAFLTILIGSTIALALLGDTQSENFVKLAGWTLGAILTMIFVAMTYRRTAESRQAMRLTGTGSSLLMALLPGVLIAIVLDTISRIVSSGSTLSEAVLNLPEVIPLFEQSAASNMRILSVVFLVFAQPIAEELVFRGVALPAFRSSFGAWSGLAFSSFVYAVLHFLAYPPAGQDITLLWYALVVPLLAGLVFGVVRIVTDSTRAAILAHSAFGATMIVMVFLTVG